MRFSPMPGRGRTNVVPRGLFAIIIAGGALALLSLRLDGIDLSAVGGAMASVSAIAWLAALAATSASFLAVARYDVLIHRWLDTGIDGERALISGASAIALSQTLGFGLATGTLARWRSLPDLSLTDAARVTAHVSALFMVALGFLAAAALALAPGTGSPAYLLLALPAAIGLIVVSFARPGWLPFHPPPAGLMLRLLGLAAADVGFAALALWMLVPGDAVVIYPALLAAFVVGLGAGLLSGAPGGVGPFELCLITMLPAVAEPDLIAAILAFRLIYYAIPACLGFLALARPLSAPDPVAPSPRGRVVRAEAEGMVGEPGHGLFATSSGALHVAEASQTLVALGDPASGGALRATDLDRFARHARGRGLAAAVYRIGPRSAVLARRMGWQVLAVSEEAWLTPATFSETGPERRQLRRKLAHAARAGVSLTEAGPDLPLARMARISAAWARRSGGERGFSMGRFDPDTLPNQRVYLAWHEGRLIAFATFHANSREWVLNLMRSECTAPDGAMHALIHAATREAAKEGVGRLSLSAMPLARPPLSLTRIAEPGLRQFKLTFAPHRSTRYLAAPTRTGLWVAGIDILLRIRRPESAGSPRHAALQQAQGGSSETEVVRRTVCAHIHLKPQDQE